MATDGSSAGVTFPPTMWSRVRLAVAADEPGADQALNELCRAYERPVMVFILRKGYPPFRGGPLTWLRELGAENGKLELQMLAATTPQPNAFEPV